MSNPNATPSSTPAGASGTEWWRHGLVWMVIGGPAAVIAAGIATVVIAVNRPDPVVASDYWRRGIEINKTLAARDKALMPALQGRNHAATDRVPQR